MKQYYYVKNPYLKKLDPFTACGEQKPRAVLTLIRAVFPDSKENSTGPTVTHHILTLGRGLLLLLVCLSVEGWDAHQGHSLGVPIHLLRRALAGGRG